ncbi:RNA 2',3'-cyclic phosphodiesterase [Candidatus Saccharibacteria bacterium]|nr:RNA 2',3'-cyclic phosphodiesterase [Candidatus Saccharibacteria bacterium]
MIRAFLGVPLPQSVKKELGKEIKKLTTALSDWNVNWVKPENLHVTLIFFGSIPEEGVEALQGEIEPTLTGVGPFKVKTGALFASQRPVWLEIDKGGDKLAELQKRLADNLSLKGVEESRPFHPHLTLGRVKKRGRAKPPKASKNFSWKADRAVLYESKLDSSGSTYKELFSFTLSQ